MERTIVEFKCGFGRDALGKGFICHVCGRIFEDGEFFQVGDRFFDAARAVREHVQLQHGDVFELLTALDKKQTGITDNQRELLTLMRAGLNDKAIGDRMGTSPSTVRHQRFMFREKAKQARLYLALYELASEAADNAGSEMVDPHPAAKMVDDRYLITREEEEQIIASSFSSLEPLKLANFSAKQKKKIVALRRIAQVFKPGQRYHEREVNDILREIYDDFATIRRYLIEYGFMDRTKDGREYWRT